MLNDAREFSIPLAKRRMYRPTKQMRKAAERNGHALTDEPRDARRLRRARPVDEAPSVVDEAPAVEEALVVEDVTPEPAEDTPVIEASRTCDRRGTGASRAPERSVDR